MIRSCVLLFKSCLREVSGRAKIPPCGMDISLAVGNVKRWFLFHLNVASPWYRQNQSSLSKCSNHSLMLWACLKCKANNRNLRKREGFRNNIFSFFYVFFIFLADYNLPECVWPTSAGLDLFRLEGRLSSHCPTVCSSCKRQLCSAAFNTEDEGIFFIFSMIWKTRS